MLLQRLSNILVEQHAIPSAALQRYVIIDCYLPSSVPDPASLSLLLLNDGQSLDEMPLAPLLDEALGAGTLAPLLCVGLHCNKDRKDEYGTAGILDYAGRGTKAAAYQQFIVTELLPFLHTQYRITAFRRQAIAGFSLGGLSAVDTAWNHPGLFTTVGVFSGSLWWRSRDVGPGYDDQQHRIMHSRIRQGVHQPGLRFYFMTGSLDETADRNGNGVIDSIDDTLDLIGELETLGYRRDEDIAYVNLPDGRHDIPTWGRAMPAFLQWGWGVTPSQPVADTASQSANPLLV